jgi:hypothetical protein
MEKTFQLDQKEAGLLAQLDQERQQALATIGAMSLDMEQARKNLDSVAERQKGFIRQAVSARGVEQFANARIQGGALFVTLPDHPVPTEGGPRMVGPNGPASEVVPAPSTSRRSAKE